MHGEKETEQYIIKSYDHYSKCLNDSCFVNRNENQGASGYVEIYDRDKYGNENFIGKHNLVVYHGRELIAQKIMKLNNQFATPELDEFICWLGVGSGGANPGDPFNPSPPTNSDIDLATSVPINTSDPVCADFHDGSFYKRPIDEVIFEVDSLNENSWLIIRTTTTIGLSDCVDGEINEAGLFTALENTPGYEGPFHLFSRITFPTLIKTITRELIFVWYLFT